MRIPARGAILGTAVLLAAAGGATARGQGATTIWSGVYTDVQAARGERSYKAACGRCHSDDLLGDSGPALVGEPFLQRWNNTTVHDLMTTLRQTMPQDAPDSLGVPGYVDLIAFLLKSNGAPAGSAELASETTALQGIKITERAPAR